MTALLDTFFDGWAKHQGLLLERLRRLTPEQVLLRTAPEMWTIWQLAAHMAGGRAHWMHDVLGEGDPGVRDMFRVTTTTVPGLPLSDAGWEDDETRSRTPDELVDGLRRTWDVVAGCLQRWTPDDLAVQVERHRPTGTTKQSRAWVLWHLMEHDVHHSGEISQILGAHGLGGLDL